MICECNTFLPLPQLYSQLVPRCGSWAGQCSKNPSFFAKFVCVFVSSLFVFCWLGASNTHSLAPSQVLLHTRTIKYLNNAPPEYCSQLTNYFLFYGVLYPQVKVERVCVCKKEEPENLPSKSEELDRMPE